MQEFANINDHLSDRDPENFVEVIGYSKTQVTGNGCDRGSSGKYHTHFLVLAKFLWPPMTR